MKTWTSIIFSVAILSLALAGCSQQQADDSAVSAEGRKYLLTSEPSGAEGVLAAREKDSGEAEVLVVGRIGGSTNPWTEGVAAFTIVDPSKHACEGPEENCPTPWDYCCESGVAEATALVNIVDEQGNLVMTDARKLLNLKELQTVVVRGKPQREGDSFKILATGVFVK